mgnify:CR=1 FL=1
MVWTAPMTFTANTVLTAAQLNVYLRDNFNETAPAKATTAGYHFVSTGTGAISERPVDFNYIETGESTTSTSFTNLTTAGPQLTLTTGSRVLWMINAYQNNSISNNSAYAGVAITGASSIPASTSRSASTDGLGAGQNSRAGYFHMESGLTPGSNTFTMQYMVAAGSGTFAFRRLVIICF